MENQIKDINFRASIYFLIVFKKAVTKPSEIADEIHCSVKLRIKPDQ